MKILSVIIVLIITGCASPSLELQNEYDEQGRVVRSSLYGRGSYECDYGTIKASSNDKRGESLSDWFKSLIGLKVVTDD